MKVKSFMTTKTRAVTCMGQDKIKSLIMAMLDAKISCVVVLDKDEGKFPVGVVTKTDLAQAYLNQLPLDTQVEDIMSRKLLTVKSDLEANDVAELLQQNKTHHAIIVDRDGQFLGITSTWDISRELILDNKAWPYNRQEKVEDDDFCDGIHES